MRACVAVWVQAVTGNFVQLDCVIRAALIFYTISTKRGVTILLFHTKHYYQIECTRTLEVVLN